MPPGGAMPKSRGRKESTGGEEGTLPAEEKNKRGCLVIVVVTAAGYDIDPTVFHMINQAVFFIDPSAVFTMKVFFQGFRFPDPGQDPVPFYVFDKHVDAF